MGRMLTLKVYMTIGMLTLTASGQAGHTQKYASPEKILGRQVSVTTIDKIKIGDVLREALSSASVPGGIVTVSDCGTELRYTLVLAGTSLRDVLNAVTSADSRYKWQINKGVVNLVPHTNVPELFNLRISEFSVENARTIDYALGELLALPEVKRLTGELNLSEIRRGGIGYLREEGDDKGETGFTVRCKDVTFREALNAIVRAQGRAVWLYWEKACEGQRDFSIEFLVR